MTTVGDRIQTAVRKQRTTLAAVARKADVPAPWLRSTATDHVGKPDPQRLQRVSDALGLDYRELLALTDQLGAVEELERATTPSVSGPHDLTALVQALDRQTVAINALVERLDRQQDDGPEWAEAVVRAVLAGLQLGGAAAGSGAPHALDAPLPGKAG